jgi:S1-C subfamily serine protease
VRPGQLAVVSLIAAVLGGAAVLAVGKGAGWLGRGTTTVVVRARSGPPPTAPAAVRSDARPLAGNGFDPARIYSRRSAGVVTIYSYFEGDSVTGEAQGSGFVASRDGYILTNSHVITNPRQQGSDAPARAATRVYIEFRDHDRVPARVVGWDIFDDIGVLKVDPAAHLLSPVPLGDSSRIAVGQPVAAIGSPFGNENSLAVGVISATRRSISSLTSAYDLVDAIQTDAPINRGNSGGPLFDARGRVIGINAQIRSETGNAEGVGFAVPINSAAASMRQLIARGRVAYAYVGVRSQTLTASLAQRFGYPARSGALVESVVESSAGDRAGLKGGGATRVVNDVEYSPGGDLIVAIDGERVSTAEDVVRIVTSSLAPGQTALFTVYRGRTKHELPVRLERRPENPAGG